MTIQEQIEKRKQEALANIAKREELQRKKDFRSTIFWLVLVTLLFIALIITIGFGYEKVYKPYSEMKSIEYNLKGDKDEARLAKVAYVLNTIVSYTTNEKPTQYLTENIFENLSKDGWINIKKKYTDMKPFTKNYMLHGSDEKIEITPSLIYELKAFADKYELNGLTIKNKKTGDVKDYLSNPSYGQKFNNGSTYTKELKFKISKLEPNSDYELFLDIFDVRSSAQLLDKIKGETKFSTTNETEKEITIEVAINPNKTAQNSEITYIATVNKLKGDEKEEFVFGSARNKNDLDKSTLEIIVDTLDSEAQSNEN